MKIAQASAESGLSIDTLRYYDKVGLVTPKRQSGQRIYSAQDLDELDSIRRLRELGISIDEIRTLLEMDRTLGNLATISAADAERLHSARELLDRHSSRLELQIQTMQNMRATFQKMTSKLTRLLESGGLGHEQ